MQTINDNNDIRPLLIYTEGNSSELANEGSQFTDHTVHVIVILIACQGVSRIARSGPATDTVTHKQEFKPCQSLSGLTYWV